MNHPIDSITQETIERGMRRAHALRSHAILDAIGMAGQALRRGLKAVVSVFA